MTDNQVAVHTNQMTKLDEFITRQRKIAAECDEAPANLPLKSPWQQTKAKSSCYFYSVRISESKFTKTWRQIYDALHALRIMADLYYVPVHRKPYCEPLGFKMSDFPAAEAYYREMLRLHYYSSRTRRQQIKASAAFAEAPER